MAHKEGQIENQPWGQFFLYGFFMQSRILTMPTANNRIFETFRTCGGGLGQCAYAKGKPYSNRG